ncbi:LD-carboxypeptidase [Halobacillus yeomjeoni]|uniref:S66 family peptidase n=1 Tax=Halobacillus yeomjeoni TaxID=311194 RepID=UPI001CD6B64D|nr:S66 peptidase family protein [Halobacillus yeomjeoni]MCA0983938.1 LD-carboxypeptidase [Halobacillus yeomjeoni]
MYPDKLKQGDEVRVISPAESLTMIAPDQRALAKRRIEKLGVSVTFSQYAEADDNRLSIPIEKRVHDLHEAFRDPDVKMILTTIGGFNSNQLLKYLDFDMIKDNPKILCGFSDITVLSNAIYKKTGLVTYSGPHYSTFGMEKGIDYTWDHFVHIFTDQKNLDIHPADHWSDDPWYMDQQNRTFHTNEGYVVLQEGKSEGTSIGGNLCTLNLLQGTEYMPPLEDTILFLEDDEMTIPQTFDRDLQSLLHQPGFDKVKGIVLGRFQEKSGLSIELLREIIESKQELKGLPIIAQASFGHTTPQFTFPIGGKVSIQAGRDNECKIKIIEH